MAFLDARPLMISWQSLSKKFQSRE